MPDKGKDMPGRPVLPAFILLFQLVLVAGVFVLYALTGPFVALVGLLTGRLGWAFREDLDEPEPEPEPEPDAEADAVAEAEPGPGAAPPARGGAEQGRA